MTTILDEAVEAVIAYKATQQVSSKLCCPLRKQWSFLGNMSKVTGGIVYMGMLHPTAEHAYHWGCLNYLGVHGALEIVSHFNPVEVKKGAKVLYKKWGPLPPDTKLEIMKDVIAAKFEPLSFFAKRLEGTGDKIIIEGNWWHDNFWGMDYLRPQSSENYLGRILMDRREELRA